MAEPAGPEAGATADGSFRGFERSLPENCVEYMLFVIDTKLEQQRQQHVFSRLDAVRKAAVQLSSRLTSEYVWQRGAFNVEVKSDKGLVYLHGVTDYGDSVEDEWLIVYLLRELTKQFPDLWVRISDSDGEFLLVEAANVLPRWLSPENDANRAWVHAGQLRIIPLAPDGSPQPQTITLPQAVSTLQSASQTLVHSPFVEAEAFYRLEKYPAQIQDSIHYAMVSIPRRLAYLIHQAPRSIAPAVEAFYLRDPIAMKPLMSSPGASLVFSPRDFVDVSVKFTKVLYAQLKSQVFSAPPAWNHVFSSSEKQAAGSGGGEVAQNKHAMLELGMKVTCGYEMLASTAAKSSNRAAREIALLLQDLAEDGDSVLPTDADIASWENCSRNDDDSWMDINFEDFERELEGKGLAPKTGTFADAGAPADLRKIVSRFEAFLNDDKAGLDGAEHDEMDVDDDEDEDEDEDSDSEDHEISFDEEEFARMMREMMGLPADANKSTNTSGGKSSGADLPKNNREDEEIRQLSEQMEAELKGYGALSLNTEADKPRALKGKGKEKEKEVSEKTALQGTDDEGEDEEVDIDYNLAKNILESFKGQAGMAGPVGTMLAGMGIQLPRDEGEDESGRT
ncbi:hypothetical protein KVR01_007338 [Diaporthe batatas]|uniref:uncharacterized protein n=1 Tax=Diaporthe batatas TaxID=748121 RepID=UPI001D03B708|nr:uncharacterized protein KVR01_007338 [Diaporthe batatas]KAG8162860.1 hypothetical protein KVR01_007338 [Diaporthe batatas]